MTNWTWNALVCSTIAVFGEGCGGVAVLTGDTVDASTGVAGAGDASIQTVGVGDASTGVSPERAVRPPTVRQLERAVALRNRGRSRPGRRVRR